MAAEPTREHLISVFGPAAALIADVVARARTASAFTVVATSNPEVRRDSHLQRLAGAKRWMLTADGLVDRQSELPEGFGVLSSDADHNGGRYVFRFPGGVFTIRREPHKEDEGSYLQEQLDVFKDAPLAEGLAGTEVKIFVSVPATGFVRLIVVHPAFDEAMVISLDEILERHRPPVDVVPTAPPRRSVVRSTRVRPRKADAPIVDP
jgi:hypothetical protein